MGHIVKETEQSTHEKLVASQVHIINQKNKQDARKKKEESYSVRLARQKKAGQKII